MVQNRSRNVNLKTDIATKIHDVIAHHSSCIRREWSRIASMLQLLKSSVQRGGAGAGARAR